MTISGNQLLSALGSGILPGGNLDKSDESAQKQDKHLDFTEVLRRVQNGQASDLGMKIGKEVSPQSMTSELRERVGIASDRAVVKGVHQALVDLGESFVRVDVRNRVIEAQFEPSDGGVVEGIDGFVSMRPIRNDEASSESGVQPIQSVSARVVRNRSLADVLSSITP